MVLAAFDKFQGEDQGAARFEWVAQMVHIYLESALANLPPFIQIEVTEEMVHGLIHGTYLKVVAEMAKWELGVDEAPEG
jgi:hypothetical protein